MGPEAVQGYFTYYARKPLNTDLKQAMALGMKNSCHVWREDGPVFKALTKK